jgi:hypothetical protein
MFSIVKYEFEQLQIAPVLTSNSDLIFERIRLPVLPRESVAILNESAAEITDPIEGSFLTMAEWLAAVQGSGDTSMKQILNGFVLADSISNQRNLDEIMDAVTRMDGHDRLRKLQSRLDGILVGDDWWEIINS